MTFTLRSRIALHSSVATTLFENDRYAKKISFVSGSLIQSRSFFCGEESRAPDGAASLGAQNAFSGVAA